MKPIASLVFFTASYKVKQLFKESSLDTQADLAHNMHAHAPPRESLR
jgi:hypothetical protein